MGKITLENMEQIARQKTCNCPDCGSNELTVGLISGGAPTHETGIYQSGFHMGFEVNIRSCGIKAILSTSCGLIIKQFAESPGELKKI